MTPKYEAIRRLAAARADTERKRVFAMRAREYGVVNAKTRPLIEAEATEAAAAAAREVYVNAGYVECARECGRLASPKYRFCPACASTSINHPQLKLGF